MEIGKWKMAQTWRHFKRPASSKGLWKQFVEESKERDQMSQGGTPQLVQPGPGRQGYKGEPHPNISGEYSSLKGTYVNQKRYEAYVKKLYEKNSDYAAIQRLKKKFKGKKNISGHDLVYGMDAETRNNLKENFETSIQQDKNKRWLKQKNYMTVDQLADDLGISRRMFHKSIKAENIPGIKIQRNITTPETGPNTVWVQKPSEKLKATIIKLHPGTAAPGMKKFTVEAIQKLHGDEDFIKFIENFDPKKTEMSPANVRKIFSGESAYSPYVLNQYAAVLDGSEKIEGIKLNKELAKKIKDNIYYSASGESGAWHRAARKIAINELNALYNPDKIKGKNFQSRVTDIRALLDNYGLGKLQVDEIQAIRTGWRGGTGPYSIFSQLLTKKMNTKLKGSQFDAQTSIRQGKLNDAIKAKEWDLVDEIIKEQDDYVKHFKDTHPQFEKANLTKFDLRKPKDVMGDKRWYSLPKETRNVLRQNWRDKQYSLNLGKNLTTHEELKGLLDNPKKAIPFLKRLGYGKHCKASGGRVGFADAGAVTGEIECILDDVKKNKADLNSPIEKVRNTAILKNKKATEIAEQLPKIGKWFRRGFQGTFGTIGLDHPLGWAIEGILEGGIYEYYRRQGHTHEQAFQETFTPGIVAGRPHDVPWYGGAEKLLEKELYQIKGENEFMDVENRPPMQDPEFGQVIGERESVKRYIENEKALAEAEAKYNQLYTGYEIATTGRQGSAEKGEKYKNAMEDTWQEINSLKDQLDLDRDMYEAAVEKQETDRGVRAIEYGEYGTGDTPELAKKREERRHKEFLEYRKGKQRSFYLPKGKLQERVEDPLAETPYTFLETDETLPAFSLEPGMRFLWDEIPRYQGEEGTKRKWQDLRDAGGWDLMDKIGLAGGVANMAEGGIIGLLKK